MRKHEQEGSGQTVSGVNRGRAVPSSKLCTLKGPKIETAKGFRKDYPTPTRIAKPTATWTSFPDVADKQWYGSGVARRKAFLGEVCQGRRPTDRSDDRGGQKPRSSPPAVIGEGRGKDGGGKEERGSGAGEGPTDRDRRHPLSSHNVCRCLSPSGRNFLPLGISGPFCIEIRQTYNDSSKC